MRSARRPDAATFPEARACGQVVRPTARRRKVTASVSTTLGGVPRVCRGPGSPIAHCTAAKGGTRTSTERPGCRSASTATSARLARAVAVAEAFGPEAGLAALEGIEIPGSHRVAAVRAELLSRRGDAAAARASYDAAIAACRNDTERAHLLDRQRALPGG